MPEQQNSPAAPRWKKRLVGDFTLRRLACSLIEVYLCIVGWAWLFSDRIAFQPPAATYAEGHGVYRIATPGGEKIAVLGLTNAAASQVVLYAHGNAEDIGCVRDTLESYRDAGFEVYTFDYRGYGLSDGRPSTRKAYEDLDTLYRHLVDQKGIPPERLIFHGRSLGAAVVLQVASRRPAAGVIVESAFLTAFRARTQIPVAPFDKMRNDRAIRRLNSPVLVIHGEDDQTIRTWQGKRLYALAHEPKSAYWVPHADHDDVLVSNEAEYWRQLRRFAASVGSASRPQAQP